MYNITLKNGKTFSCDSDTTIFDAALKANITLEHSCLKSRCKSCAVRVISGKTENIENELVLSEEELKQNFVLSCNAKPISDLSLNVEDLGNIKFFDKKIVPAKINLIERIRSNVIKLTLRLPPTCNFQFNSGQYINLIKDNIKRSYSIANSNNTNQLEFFIDKYEKGLMSKYLFEDAQINDLLRIEGPLGSFFLRESKYKNIIFLATGTGIAPIKSILDNIFEVSNEYSKHIFWLFIGAKFEDDILWHPEISDDKICINYIPVLSQQSGWTGQKGYVQNAVLKEEINLENSQVYACGSSNMINDAKQTLIKNSLMEDNFFSDVFTESN